MEASPNTPERSRHGNAIRAWQLALLRFAVTMDNADRLALLAIATELDGPGFRPSAPPAFKFFYRTSVELCHAVINPKHVGSVAVLQRHLDRSDDERLKRALAAALAIDIPGARMPMASTKPNHDLWRGLKPQNGRKRA